MTARWRVSLILPTLNERDNVVALIDRAFAAYPALHEVIAVDDDSTDGTHEAVERYAAAHPERHVAIDVLRPRRGLTRSLWHGVTNAGGDVVVWMDADLSMPPEDIPRLLDALERGADVAVGSRFVRGGGGKGDTRGTPDSPLGVLLSAGLNVALRWTLAPRFRDWTSGFIAIPRAVVLDLGLRGDHGEYFIDLAFRALRSGYAVVEVPYVIVPRRYGRSKTGEGLWDYARRGRKYLATALRLRVSSLVSPSPRRVWWR